MVLVVLEGLYQDFAVADKMEKAVLFQINQDATFGRAEKLISSMARLRYRGEQSRGGNK